MVTPEATVPEHQDTDPVIFSVDNVKVCRGRVAIKSSSVLFNDAKVRILT